MRIKFVLFLSLVIPSGMLSAQTISLSERLDSIMMNMTFWDKIHQLYPYDVLNTGDNPRLGIGGFYMTDGPHGYRYPESTGGTIIGSFDSVPEEGKATSFPVSVAVAATWDTELAFRMAGIMAKEFLARGINQALAPSMYLCNEPRNGRSAESFGEDPYLASKMAVATVKGMQSTPIIATVKSFIGENAQDTRMTDSISIGKRMLMEHWGLPFKHAIQDANAMSVMSAYVRLNDLNNLGGFFYSSENYSFNTQILREKWGYPYYMVSDWGAVHNAELALRSGLDVSMGNWIYATDLWLPLVNGTLPMHYLETAVKRVLKTKVISGITTFQPRIPEDYVGGSESIDVCYEAGIKSLVLLKNEDAILPIYEPSVNYIAVIGPSAAMPQLDGYGSSFVFPTDFTTVVEGILNKVGPAKLLYTKGCDIYSGDTSGFADALAFASYADVVVYVGGLDWTLEGEQYDRVTGSTDLPGVQQELINRLAAVNPNLVTVVMSGGIVNFNQCLHNIKGLVYGFYPGQEQGNAIADVLFGDYNPGGKLPVTMPADDAQLPLQNTDFNDDWGCGYRWFDKEMLTPAFAFGHGLSYTTFTYNTLNIQNNSVYYGDSINITVSVTNTGNRYGEEVVQLYVSHTGSAMPMPEKQLKGFKRIGLSSGQTATISFVLTPEDLYIFDETSDTYDVLTGNYAVKVGGASDNLPLTGTFTINPAAAKPDIEPSALLCYPPFPRSGDTVVFFANIKNRGLKAISNELITAEIYVENQMISKIATTDTIIKGGMIQAEALVTVNGKNYWIAPAPGDYTISINTDGADYIAECNENNNSYSRILTVYDTLVVPLEVNLAWRKPVTVSSVSDTVEYKKEWAVDGFRNSKWVSAADNNEFIFVDLLTAYQLKKITVSFSDAFAEQYHILVSADTISWDTIAGSVNGEAGKIIFATDNLARYIKMEMFNPHNDTVFGVYEIQAFGLSNTQQISNIHLDSPCLVYPNPCPKGETFTIKFNRNADIIAEISDIRGNLFCKNIVNNNNVISVNTINMLSGMYFIRIVFDGEHFVKKFIIQ